MNNEIEEILKNVEGAETMEYVVIVAIIITVGSAAYNIGLGPILTAAVAALVAAAG